MKNQYENFSKRIDGVAKRRDSVQYESESLAIATKIEWAWKFKRITTDQMHELCDRLININERNYR